MFVSPRSPKGPLPRKESDTKVCFGRRDSPVDSEWSASAAEGPSDNTVSVSISPPPTAPVGLYSLTLELDGQKIRLGEFVLLFNAWCPGESYLTFNGGHRRKREADLLRPHPRRRRLHAQGDEEEGVRFSSTRADLQRNRQADQRDPLELRTGPQG